MKFINLHTHQNTKDSVVLSIYNNRAGHLPYELDYFFSMGIHPWDAHLFDIEKAESIFHEVVHLSHFMAIGECGLDKFAEASLSIQIPLFESQLRFALKNNKPVIIHCVKAFDELLEVTKPYLNKIPLIIHGFNKSIELAKDLIQKGFYLSINPTVLNDVSYNHKALPIEKIFLETDDKENTTIEKCYEILSSKINLTIPDLKKKIYSNFDAVFYEPKK